MALVACPVVFISASWHRSVSFYSNLKSQLLHRQQTLDIYIYIYISIFLLLEIWRQDLRAWEYKTRWPADISIFLFCTLHLKSNTIFFDFSMYYYSLFLVSNQLASKVFLFALARSLVVFCLLFPRSINSQRTHKETNNHFLTFFLSFEKFIFPSIHT